MKLRYGFFKMIFTIFHHLCATGGCTQIAKFMGPTWGPPGSCRPQMGPMLAPWTLLLGYVILYPFLSYQYLSCLKMFWAQFQYKDCMCRYRFPIINTRQSWYHLIIIMGIPILGKVHLHGRRLARDILQRDLLRGNSVYMVGSCHARLLRIIHVSAVSEVGVLKKNARDSLCHAAILSSNLKCRPGRSSRASAASSLSPCKHSSCIPMFLFCGVAVAPQSCCLSRPV